MGLLGVWAHTESTQRDEWKNLTRYGVASKNVMKKLWVGASPSQVDFLSLFMIKLGLLVELNEDKKNWKSAIAGMRYLAPNTITTLLVLTNLVNFPPAARET